MLSYKQYLLENEILDVVKERNIQHSYIDGKIFLHLYHGTSKNNFNKILKFGKFNVNTYFTEDENIAKRFAQMYGKSYVVDFVIVNSDSLVFDGNYFYSKKILNFKNGVYI